MYSRYICPLRELEYHLATLLCSRWASRAELLRSLNASRAELLRITFKQTQANGWCQQTQANGWCCNQYIFGRPEGAWITSERLCSVAVCLVGGVLVGFLSVNRNKYIFLWHFFLLRITFKQTQANCCLLSICVAINTCKGAGRRHQT